MTTNQIRNIISKLESEAPALRWHYDGIRDLIEGCHPSRDATLVTLQYITPVGRTDNGILVLATYLDEVKTFVSLRQVIEYLQLPAFANPD